MGWKDLRSRRGSFAGHGWGGRERGATYAPPTHQLHLGGGRHGRPSIQTVTENAAPSLPRAPGVPFPHPVCYLNVLLANQPGPVGQDLVDLTEPAEFGGDAVQPSQPQGVTAHPQELQHMEIHQVPTSMPGSGLQERHKALRSVGKAPQARDLAQHGPILPLGVRSPPSAPNLENQSTSS